MKKRVFFAILPPKSDVIQTASTVKILNDFFAVQLHNGSDELNPVNKISVRDLRRDDRLVVLIAPQDVSVIRVRRPPLSHSDMLHATPALLKDALDIDTNAVISLMSRRSFVENGVAYGYISLCDQIWINYVKQYLLGLQCKNIDIFPFFEIIPSAKDKCNFLIDFDDLDCIAWRCGEHVGGGSAQLKNAGVDHANEFCGNIAKIHGFGPTEANIWSTILEHELLPVNWTGVKIKSLVENAVDGNKFDEALNFMGVKKLSIGINSWERYTPNRFLLFLILFVFIESVLVMYQHYRLQGQSKILTSALFEAIIGKERSNLNLMGEESALLHRAIRNIRYAKGENSDDDFDSLLRVAADSKNATLQNQLRQISYKNSALLITADPKATLFLDSNKFPSYTLNKVKDGVWKISRNAS